MSSLTWTKFQESVVKTMSCWKYKQENCKCVESIFAIYKLYTHLKPAFQLPDMSVLFSICAVFSGNSCCTLNQAIWTVLVSILAMPAAILISSCFNFVCRRCWWNKFTSKNFHHVYFLHKTLAELASVNERQIRCSEHVFTDESVTVLSLFMNIQEIFIGSMFHGSGTLKRDSQLWLTWSSEKSTFSTVFCFRLVSLPNLPQKTPWAEWNLPLSWKMS